MKSKAVQFLEANQSGERSTFVDDAKWRQENASWLRRSRRVAYAIMDYMQDKGLSRNDVAEKLGVRCEQDPFWQGELLVQDNLRN